MIGLGLMFVPGTQGFGVAVLVGASTGAFLGAGAAGLMSDVHDCIKGTTTSDKDWGTKIGLGFAFGAATGAAGVVITKFIPVVEVGEGLIASGRKEVGRLVMRTIKRLALSTTVGSSLGGLKKVTENAIADKPLDEGIGGAMAWGAGVALLSQGTSKTIYGQYYVYSYFFRED